jgi:peptide/nickel transport system substrate-binding protein
MRRFTGGATDFREGKDMLRLSRRHLLHSGAALGAAAMAGPRFAAAADGNILRVRSYLDIQNLDPADRISAVDDDVFNSILVKLIDFKPGESWEWELDAAEMIEQVDDTHVRFALRRGVGWTNGFGELTAEDVKYSFERIADPERDAAYHVDWSALDHVEITEDYAGTIVLKEPFAPLFSTSLPYGSGAIVCKAAVEQLDGQRFTTEVPAQCGPYLLQSWTPKQRIVLVRNPDWAGPRPHFDEVHIYPIQDFKAAEIAFEAGEVDMSGITLDTLARYESSPPPGSELLVRPSLAYFWLGMNVENEVLADPTVRKAIQHAIDVEEVLEAAFFGGAERATGIIAPGLIGHRGYNLVDYDPDKARALLDEAGVGSGLNLRLDARNSTDFVTAAQVIQAQLAQIGVNVEVNPYEGGAYSAMQMNPESDEWRETQLMFNRFSMAPDPAWATEWFTGDQTWNWQRLAMEEFDRLHHEAAREIDPEKRHAMYVRMQDLMEESGAYLFMTHGSNAYIYRDTIVPAMRPDAQNYVFKRFTTA